MYIHFPCPKLEGPFYYKPTHPAPPKLSKWHFPITEKNRLFSTSIKIDNFICKWKGNTRFAPSFHAFLDDLQNLQEVSLKKIDKARECVNIAQTAHKDIHAFILILESQINAIKFWKHSPELRNNFNQMYELQIAAAMLQLPEELTEETVSQFSQYVAQTLKTLKGRLAKILHKSFNLREDVLKTNGQGGAVFLGKHLPYSPSKEPLDNDRLFQPEESFATKKFEEYKGQLSAIILKAENEFSSKIDSDIKTNELFAPLLLIRENAWKILDSSCFKCQTNTDLYEFDLEIKKNIYVDKLLIAIIEHSKNFSNKNQKILQGNITQYFALQSGNDDVTLSSIIEEAWTIAKISKLTLIKEAQHAFLQAEKLRAESLIDAFLNNKLLFEKLGHTNVAQNYEVISSSLKKTAEILELEPVGISDEDLKLYVNKWNAILDEFEPKEQIFSKLQKTENKLKNTIQMLKLSDESSQTLTKIYELKQISSKEKKAALNTSDDLQKYINTLKAMMKKND